MLAPEEVKEFKLDGKNFQNLNVVTLELTLSANFTPRHPSGLSFKKQRIVVLDAGNQVLYLSGDSPTEAAIRISARRGHEFMR